MRRTKVDDPETLVLFPDWRHHAFLTDVEGDAVALDQFHRDHARVELAVRDLKEGSGLEHCPSSRFNANAAWLECGVIAHNLIRWATALGEIVKPNELTVSRTQRMRLLAISGARCQPFGTTDATTFAELALGGRIHERLERNSLVTGARLGLTPARRGAPTKNVALTTRSGLQT